MEQKWSQKWRSKWRSKWKEIAPPQVQRRSTPCALQYLLSGIMYAEFRPRIIILKYMPRLINYSGEYARAPFRPKIRGKLWLLLCIHVPRRRCRNVRMNAARSSESLQSNCSGKKLAASTSTQWLVAKALASPSFFVTKCVVLVSTVGSNELTCVLTEKHHFQQNLHILQRNDQ